MSAKDRIDCVYCIPGRILRTHRLRIVDVRLVVRTLLGWAVKGTKGEVAFFFVHARS